MDLVFNTKIKTDLLEKWRSNETIYVCAMRPEQGGQPPSKIDCKEVPFGAAASGKLTYSTPINLTIGDSTTVQTIHLTTNIVSDEAIATNLLAVATVVEAFPYGGTFRINSIELEIK